MNDKNTLRDSLPIELLLSLKKGKKIEIKKSHQGRFTEYCGGNVTNECISRGKNSPDPKIRKLAVFAENARGWNHKVKKGLDAPLGTLLLNTQLPNLEILGLNLDNIQEQALLILNDPNATPAQKQAALDQLKKLNALFGANGQGGAVNLAIDKFSLAIPSIANAFKSKEKPTYTTQADLFNQKVAAAKLYNQDLQQWNLIKDNYV